MPADPIPPTARPCDVEGCTRNARRRGKVCAMHSNRMLKSGSYGSPESTRLSGSFEERLWQRIDRTGGPDACWPWLGYINPDGYGMTVTPRDAEGGRQRKHTHRVAYELLIGSIPVGLVIDHLCRNRKCCNPAHMEPVTLEENTRRGQPFARAAVAVAKAARTYCHVGHPYDEENTLNGSDGHRRCRLCARERSRKHDAKRRAA